MSNAEDLDNYDKDKIEALEKKSKNSYSQKYRIIKTILMICAWISFGLNFELIGTALEDLKILLNVDYRNMANSYILRNTSYMIVTVFIGLVMDKLSNYSETLMAFAKALIILRMYLNY